MHVKRSFYIPPNARSFSLCLIDIYSKRIITIYIILFIFLNYHLFSSNSFLFYQFIKRRKKQLVFPRSLGSSLSKFIKNINTSRSNSSILWANCRRKLRRLVINLFLSKESKGNNILIILGPYFSLSKFIQTFQLVYFIKTYVNANMLYVEFNIITIMLGVRAGRGGLPCFWDGSSVAFALESFCFVWLVRYVGKNRDAS